MTALMWTTVLWNVPSKKWFNTIKTFLVMLSKNPYLCIRTLEGFRCVPLCQCTSPKIPLPTKTPTLSLILRYTAGRSPRSSGVAGRDRSAASPLSSMEGSERSRTGWAPTHSGGWSAPPRSGKLPLTANWCLWKDGRKKCGQQVSSSFH